MSSQRVIYFAENQFYPQDLSKQKLQRKSTRLTNSPEILSQPLNNNQQDIQSLHQPPSPVQSSYQSSSVEAKYLSYLAHVIDSSPSSDQQQISSHYHNSEYWHVIYQCAIYVKKWNQRTSIDDNLILSQISQYLTAGRIHPQAKNEIGRQLLMNGYFLCAYAIATGRIRRSMFIFKYLMQYFHNQLEIQTNYQQFNHILQDYIENEKAQEVLNIPTQITTPGQQQQQHQHQKQNHSTLNNHHHRNNNQDKDNQQPIRRAILTIPIDQFSQSDSKTINLDDLLQSENVIH